MVKRSNRGGYRPGAGRKGEWRSGKTKAVKLPEKLAPEIMAIARAIDEGQEVKIVSTDSVTESNKAPIDSVTNSNGSSYGKVTESKLETVTESKAVKEATAILVEALALKPNAGGAIKAKVREALKKLQGEE